MKHLTLSEFYAEFPLLPWLVAETILEKNGHNPSEHQKFIASCDHRTLHHYNTHPRFRKYMDGGESREWLYAFVQHWMKSYFKSPEKYLKEVVTFN